MEKKEEMEPVASAPPPLAVPVEFSDPEEELTRWAREAGLTSSFGGAADGSTELCKGPPVPIVAEPYSYMGRLMQWSRPDVMLNRCAPRSTPQGTADFKAVFRPAMGNKDRAVRDLAISRAAWEKQRVYTVEGWRVTGGRFGQIVALMDGSALRPGDRKPTRSKAYKLMKLPSDCIAQQMTHPEAWECIGVEEVEGTLIFVSKEPLVTPTERVKAFVAALVNSMRPISPEGCSSAAHSGGAPVGRDYGPVVVSAPQK